MARPPSRCHPTPADAPGDSSADAAGRSQFRRAVGKMVAIIVVLVVLAELGVRAISAQLPEPLVYYHPSAQVKVEQMEALSHLGPPVDVVLAGTSQMAFAGDPLRFAAMSPATPVTYNAAILAGYPAASHRFLLEEVLPRLHPTTVIYGVSSEDVQPGKEAPYDQSRAAAPGLFGGLDRWASAHSALVDHREDLRDPTVLSGAFGGSGGNLVGFYRTSVIGPFGSWKFYAPRGCGPVDGEPAPVAPSAPGLFVPDPTRIATIWDTVAAMEDQGVAVIVAVMPFPDCYFEQTNSRESDAAGRRLIADGGAARGVPVVDVTADIHANDLFGDRGHVNAKGAECFTDLLVAALAADTTASPTSPRRRVGETANADCPR